MIENQVQRVTPLMGWASWNCFRTDISENRMKQQADALVGTGLAACGYTYLNMDDGFFGGRAEDGRVLFHAKRFPNGIKPVADYAHFLGLKAGIYSDAGDNTCGYYYDAEGSDGEGVGLYGHEEQDLRMYLEEYGFDFIKVDWCGGVRLGLDEEEQYTKIGNIIKKLRQETGKSLVFNICRWQFPGAWAVSVADSWRTAADICPEYSSILHQLDNIKPLRKYCGPGHVNDLDMMQLGNGMTVTEEKSHFSMWCMMSAPLVIGCDLTKIRQETLDILKNQEMIAVNQDSACLQAFVVKEFWTDGDDKVHENRKLVGEIWVKDLGEPDSKRKAVAFLNRSDMAVSMSAELSEIGFGGKPLRIRDLWKKSEVNNLENETFNVTIEPHGVEVFLVEAEEAVVVNDVFTLAGGTEIDISVPEITDEQRNDLLATGAVLVDVRTPGEYAASHEEGAINLPYMDIHGMATDYLHDKYQPVIVYCATGKRCSQAGQSLKYLGYQKVFRWKRGI